MEESSDFSQELMKIENCDRIMMVNSHKKNFILLGNIFWIAKLKTPHVDKYKAPDTHD